MECEMRDLIGSLLYIFPPIIESESRDQRKACNLGPHIRSNTDHFWQEHRIMDSQQNVLRLKVFRSPREVFFLFQITDKYNVYDLGKNQRWVI
ncbi:hypothetical protein FKM82_008066 [Ascaphus truei]